MRIQNRVQGRWVLHHAGKRDETVMDKLLEKIMERQNPTVAGLDPRLEYIPGYIREDAFAACDTAFGAAAQAIWQYNKGLIDALADIVPAVKPQSAYYEMYGWAGMRAMAQTVAYAQEKGMYVILDGKRNDIGPTMDAYATAFLGETELNGAMLPAFGADALTVNGYLGSDGIRPLLKVCKGGGKGIFVLVKTSNPSSGELQDLVLEGGGTVYDKMMQMCTQWGEELPGKYGYTGVGAVVGATYPRQLTELRKAYPDVFFLVPGYGAQGGGAADIAGAFDENGLGGIVNSSRAILCAWQKEGCNEREYAMAARREAERMQREIMDKLGRISLPIL